MKKFSILARKRFFAQGMASNRYDFSLYPEGDVETSRLLDDPELSLYCLNLETKEAVFVSTPAHIDLQAAPFYYMAQLEHAEYVFTLGFDEFVDWSARILDPHTLIMIHNIGRCGSTLLSRMISRLENCVSYSEPDCFTQIAFWRTVDDPRDELWETLLKACMKFTFRNGSQSVDTAVIKYRSGCLMLLDLFLKVFPAAKHLVMYRDCRSWVESLANLTGSFRHPSWLPREKYPEHFRFFNGRIYDQTSFPLGQLPEKLSNEERRTISWLLYMEQIRNVSSAFPGRMLPVTYGDLTGDSRACMEKMMEYCQLPRHRLADCLAVLDHDSQAGTIFARVETSPGGRFKLSGIELSQMQAILNMHPFIKNGDFAPVL